MTKQARMTKEFREDELTPQAAVRHLRFVIDLTNPVRDWLPGEGPCEIQPVDARLPAARPHRVPAAQDLDLNYSLRVQKSTQLEQKMRAVS
jgi:hypothetical protein